MNLALAVVAAIPLGVLLGVLHARSRIRARRDAGPDVQRLFQKRYEAEIERLMLRMRRQDSIEIEAKEIQWHENTTPMTGKVIRRSTPP